MFHFVHTMSYPITYLTRYNTKKNGNQKCQCDCGAIRDTETPHEFLQRFIEHVYYKAVPSLLRKNVELILSSNEYTLTILFAKEDQFMIKCSGAASSCEPYIKVVIPITNTLHMTQNTRLRTIAVTQANASLSYATPLAWAYKIFPCLDTVNELEETARARL